MLSYGPSESFGELALMYNTPRAASVIAVEDSVLWAMERLCFRTILMQSMVQKRERYEAIVSSISLLKTLDSNTRAIMVDLLEPVSFEKGSQIVNQGAASDRFYILSAGDAFATTTSGPGMPAIKTREFGEGSFFGERALLSKAPSPETVVAATDCTVLSLDRFAFERLMGPLKDQLDAESRAAWAAAEERKASSATFIAAAIRGQMARKLAVWVDKGKTAAAAADGGGAASSSGAPAPASAKSFRKTSVTGGKAAALERMAAKYGGGLTAAVEKNRSSPAGSMRKKSLTTAPAAATAAGGAKMPIEAAGSCADARAAATAGTAPDVPNGSASPGGGATPTPPPTRPPEGASESPRAQRLKESSGPSET